MTFTSRDSFVSDGLLVRTNAIAHGGETYFDCRLEVGRALQIRNIAVILFEKADKLLPFSHALWWTSLFAFEVDDYTIYEYPLHRLADPIIVLALHQELQPEDAWRYIGKLNPDFQYPYLLFAMQNARCRIRPRLLTSEPIPKTATAMVILAGIAQRLIA